MTQDPPANDLMFHDTGDLLDRHTMQRCLELARQARGQTAPNPMVGSVVVQDGEIVGEGFHPGAGQPHAEVFALRAAGDRAEGATVYVNLEPCSHFGRTPPCADALIAAKVSRVVVGMIDPNPKVSGAGVDRLRNAGIDVVVGVEEAACRQLNEAFIYRILHQRPLGTLKYGMTLDGKIATTTGHSAWITRPESRQQVHFLRAGCDAVIIGGNTVRQDNPLLTSHGQGHNPLRVVMSRSLDLPRVAQLWKMTEAPTVVFTEAGAKPDFQQFLSDRGVEVVEVPNLSPAAVMANLFDRGFLSVLWECGGTLAAAAIRDGSVQKILAFIAPKLIGGAAAPSPVGDLGFERMTEAIELEDVKWQAIQSSSPDGVIGSDLLVEGRIKRSLTS
ncbi:bifunctional diaminohydroxyphosphoribosylaminopyrimidine deaminase/5-amino-6-(5-phosphoribosylamino)uracil reductase RibD [Cyanobacteria bacterium FACHB-502]|nr:bifunctional diaminohydroxyphosphoribosylaminopyrimidine deaminase/5-amino-6-(5-phosphoribosylamino)uracil reductase RibD [Cyanobacteria bacterium FACHB-502]MBD2025510.1 bifunctional diaminohydroxyphosphoribosylaminopyrimidine deaminase/5-amino-6-(5-phosphoribosylamino)uracil reductase RibD [Leptolyngbya sp. FACHB-711]